MIIKVYQTKLEEILPLRILFLQENNFQIRYNACHERNWSDAYLLTMDSVKIGYGAVKGKNNLTDRDAVFEFYILPEFRKKSREFFIQLIEISGARFIECQSNDSGLSSMLYEFAQNINSDVVLFADNTVTDHCMEDVIFRQRNDVDKIFEHTVEPVGEYVIESKGEVVATGGFMLHYNRPFADLYMEVREDARGKGLASFLLQEVKKECYKSGRVPAARCGINNNASRGCLLNAGLKVSGFMLTGEVKK